MKKIIEIQFTLRVNEVRIKSDLIKDGVDTLFGTFLERQRTVEKDISKPADKEMYTIVLTWDTDDDSIDVVSDSGNINVTNAIISFARKQLNSLLVEVEKI